MNTEDPDLVTDVDGVTWLKTASGALVVPPQSQILPDSTSGFRTYDSSRGHCSLCGSLTCNGGCFK